MKKRQHRLKFETVSVLDNFLECIFPPRCFVCDRLLETADIRRQRNVHAACRKKLYPVVQPYCYHCGSPLADTETEYCQNCRKHRSFVAEGRSLFVYRGAVQKSMYRFKYANRRRYARFLAEEAMQRWENWMREKGSKPSFRYRCIRKKNGIADIIRLRFLAGHCQKNGYSVYSASDDQGERYTTTERTEWQRKRK